MHEDARWIHEGVEGQQQSNATSATQQHRYAAGDRVRYEERTAVPVLLEQTTKTSRGQVFVLTSVHYDCCFVRRQSQQSIEELPCTL